MKSLTILSSGNSLKDFDFSKIKGDILAINYMYKYCNPKYVFCYDKNALQNIVKEVCAPKINAILPIARHLNVDNFVNTWKIKPGIGLIREKGFVISYASTIIFAINAAFNLGYKTIYILGCDNRITSGKIHFYDDEITIKLTGIYRRAFKNFDIFYKKVAEALREDEKIIMVESSVKHFENISMNEYKKYKL